MKDTIIIDVDSTLSNSVQTIVKIINEEFNENIIYHDNHMWDFEGLLPNKYVPRAKQLFDEQKFFDKLELFPNAYDALSELSKYYNIKIGSVHNLESSYMKINWLKRKLPFVHDVVILPYNGLYDKSIIDGSIIIDDKVECLKGDRKLKLLYGCYGYNKDYKDNDVVRVNNWNDIKDLLLQIVK